MDTLAERIAARLHQALDHHAGAEISVPTAERGLAAGGPDAAANVLSVEDVARLAADVVDEDAETTRVEFRPNPSPSEELRRSVGAVEPVLESAMQTPDGAWRVEVVRRGRTRWYRVVHSRDLIDWLSIAAVHRVLIGAGIDLADLVDVDETAAEDRDEVA